MYKMQFQSKFETVQKAQSQIEVRRLLDKQKLVGKRHSHLNVITHRETQDEQSKSLDQSQLEYESALRSIENGGRTESHSFQWRNNSTPKNYSRENSLKAIVDIYAQNFPKAIITPIPIIGITIKNEENYFDRKINRTKKMHQKTKLLNEQNTIEMMQILTQASYFSKIRHQTSSDYKGQTPQNQAAINSLTDQISLNQTEFTSRNFVSRKESIKTHEIVNSQVSQSVYSNNVQKKPLVPPLQLQVNIKQIKQKEPVITSKEFTQLDEQTFREQSVFKSLYIKSKYNRKNLAQAIKVNQKIRKNNNSLQSQQNNKIMFQTQQVNHSNQSSIKIQPNQTKSNQTSYKEIEQIDYSFDQDSGQNKSPKRNFIKIQVNTKKTRTKTLPLDQNLQGRYPLKFELHTNLGYWKAPFLGDRKASKTQINYLQNQHALKTTNNFPEFMMKLTSLEFVNHGEIEESPLLHPSRFSFININEIQRPTANKKQSVCTYHLQNQNLTPYSPRAKTNDRNYRQKRRKTDDFINHIDVPESPVSKKSQPALKMNETQTRSVKSKIKSVGSQAFSLNKDLEEIENWERLPTQTTSNKNQITPGSGQAHKRFKNIITNQPAEQKVLNTLDSANRTQFGFSKCKITAPISQFQITPDGSKADPKNLKNFFQLRNKSQVRNVTPRQQRQNQQFSQQKMMFVQMNETKQTKQLKQNQDIAPYLLPTVRQQKL